MKEYIITRHAIEQAQIRLGMSEGRARYNLQLRMQVAVYQGSTGEGRVFDHYSTRTRFILAPDKDIVITVYSMDTLKTGDKAHIVPVESTGNRFIGKVKDVITEELQEAHKTFEKSYAGIIGNLIADGIESAHLMKEYEQSDILSVKTYITYLNEKVNARIKENEKECGNIFHEYNEVKNATRHLLV